MSISKIAAYGTTHNVGTLIIEVVERGKTTL
jgi:hypothetical protein